MCDSKLIDEYNAKMVEYLKDRDNYDSFLQFHSFWEQKLWPYEEYYYNKEKLPFWADDLDSSQCKQKPIEGNQTEVCQQLAKINNVPFADQYQDNNNRRSCGWFAETVQCERPPSAVEQAEKDYVAKEPTNYPFGKSSKIFKVNQGFGPPPEIPSDIASCPGLYSPDTHFWYFGNGTLKEGKYIPPFWKPQSREFSILEKKDGVYVIKKQTPEVRVIPWWVIVVPIIVLCLFIILSLMLKR